MNMTILPSTAPGEMVASISREGTRLTNPITFSNEDLPSYGAQHNLSLYISVSCSQSIIPMTLIDDGSAVNVQPLKTANLLGLQESDFAPTSQTVRGFDDTVRRISVTLFLVVCSGRVERTVKC